MFLPSTLCKLLCLHSSFLTSEVSTEWGKIPSLLSIGHCEGFREIILPHPVILLCLYKSSKLIEFTDFWNRYMCLFTSSLFVSGHLPPSIIIPFLRVSLCLFRMGHSLIKCSEFWGPVWQGHVCSCVILNLYRQDLNFPCPVTTVDKFRFICIRLVSLSFIVRKKVCLMHIVTINL